ncbi:MULTISPECIES: hypothetical protein [unclassified Granulicatella]|uniref:hypothetical protein n=1 Tax=unclassified Granulicatella TaxID=2630493 RepID=UPI001073560B|nr:MULTISPECIES: hypothetical protein [unclassified Granulicatella]MBF0781163.1 hypothetical protein [Granulicatella sp. 19428wC4_WM01]TFU91610.1 hypothetical protein E4T68_08760 [Granulicatella sp. WM01]
MDIRKIIKLLNELDEQGSNVKYIKGLQEDNIVYDISDSLCESRIVDTAQRLKKANIMEDTYAIIHLPRQYEPYKSLLLNMYNANSLSKESTNVLLNRLFKKIGINQEPLNECTELLFHKKMYKLPYVYGGKAYLPVNGSMRKSGDWVAAHFITKYGIQESSKHVWIEFENGAKLLLDMSIKGLEIQLERILHILSFQRQVINQLCKELTGLEIKVIEQEELFLERKLNHINEHDMSDANIYLKKILEVREYRENKKNTRSKRKNKEV